MSRTERPFSIVCLSSQEWHVDLPTNRQQIMLRAARRGHEVLFVETGHFVGRHLIDLVRGPRRGSLARRLFSSQKVAPAIRVRKSLNIVPWGRKYGFANGVNSALSAAAVRRSVRSLPQPCVLWLYDPCAGRMAGRCGESFSVYDCVDDYAEQVGADERRRALVAAADRGAAESSRLVFATTRPLYERQSRRNPRTHLAPNVGDYEHFASQVEVAPEVRDLPRPVIGFAGNFLPAKVSFEVLRALALARSGWSLLLVGPAVPESRPGLDELARLPNVTWVGPKPYAELPRYVAAFDVGLIPYEANDYTRSCYPLKLFEYLAAGKPVVATGVPELGGMEPDVVLAAGPNEAVAAVEAALEQTGEADRKRRMALAARNTWETRAERLLSLIDAELAAPA